LELGSSRLSVLSFFFFLLFTRGQVFFFLGPVPFPFRRLRWFYVLLINAVPFSPPPCPQPSFLFFFFFSAFSHRIHTCFFFSANSSPPRFFQEGEGRWVLFPFSSRFFVVAHRPKIFPDPRFSFFPFVLLLHVEVFPFPLFSPNFAPFRFCGPNGQF